MSDESTPAAEDTASETEATPKVRRISNKNPRKTAKPASSEDTDGQEVPIEEFDSSPPSGDLEKSEGSKKKSRRRRGKGKSQKESESPDDASPVTEETINLSDGESKDSDERDDRQNGRRDQQKQRPPQKQRPRLDSDKVAKNAWKIFLAEVSEEGVALIADNDARELARRCFRLSEIFLEEESRRN